LTRLALAVCVFAAALLAALSDDATGTLAAQEKKQPKGKAKADPKSFRPDAATLRQIAEKTEQLRKAVAALRGKKIADDVLVEVEIYLKAAENIVRFEEWLHANSGKWALTTLDQGLERAKQAEGGKAVWRDAPGKWVLRAYRSHVDGSIQPYAVLLPHDYGKDPQKKWRLDVVLHGRDSSLTEAKFIATHNGVAPKDRDYVQLEVYGRGNNAYRWAGETDVMEAITAFAGSFGHNATSNVFSGKEPIDAGRVILRGFSMGGAGTWHIGLHHPGRFCVIGPGAGFTTTRGYVANLPAKLSDYQEKCLHIYDAMDYAENAFNVPVVAYSGEKDAQKAAADNIERLLKDFKEPVKFTHLVAPGLDHQMPPEWQQKAEMEYRKYADKGRGPHPERIRLVTYTPRYGSCDWLTIGELDLMYKKAVVDATRRGQTFEIRTENVRRLGLVRSPDGFPDPPEINIDGQKVKLVEANTRANNLILAKEDGKWIDGRDPEVMARRLKEYRKYRHWQGPIDDAFMSRFLVVRPTGDGYPSAALNQFAAVWDRYFRGALPIAKPDEVDLKSSHNLVLFGDPQSNPLIARILPTLPITWTKDKLVMNGVEYDPRAHIPVLIYPNKLSGYVNYVVINSGHTFKEADLKGTNALLYPRLGDWAVIKPTPTEKDPAAYEVVAAGLFDENWQFPKK
jgi:dienelactone hydrolase